MIHGILPAWREARSIVVGLFALSLVAFLFKRWWLAFFSATLLGGVFYFFRDPERSPASTSPEWIVAPADGTVTAVEIIDELLYFKGPARRVSMFLSLFDVHVQRCPYQGRVELLHYQSGAFAPAFLKDTHTNESNFIGLRTPRGPAAVKQIAGILARRIICWPTLGDELTTGQRLGLIKFGSRVDLLLPVEVEILVQVGQPVRGGQTIVGRWLVEKEIAA
jgi:phosphatidylserine decarboxylase